MREKLLTWPFLSISLFVNLTFSNDITCLRNASGPTGVSGCEYSLGGGGGSAFPATSHDDLWYAYRYRRQSTAIMSNSTAYLSDGCDCRNGPENETRNVGNIRLKWNKIEKMEPLAFVAWKYEKFEHYQQQEVTVNWNLIMKTHFIAFIYIYTHPRLQQFSYHIVRYLPKKKRKSFNTNVKICKEIHYNGTQNIHTHSFIS